MIGRLTDGLAVFSLVLVFSIPAAFGSIDSSGASKYQALRDYIAKIASQHPKTTKVIQIGVSDSGLPIEGLQIGDGPVKNLLVATHHGNEYGSTEVAKAFADSLATAPIAGQTMFVIPVLNISGYNANNRYESANGSSYDPNRDYPGPCGTEGPFNLKSTAALASFVEKQNIVAAATLHTYSPAVVYPWGISTHDLSTGYDDIFKMLVESAVVESHYQTGNSTEVIYPADGCFEDWAYWKHGVWSILFELGYSHSPDPNAVAEMQKVNVPGMRRMFEQAPRTQAEKHEFTGACDKALGLLDRHDE
jgi:carboxypeptidase T